MNKNRKILIFVVLTICIDLIFQIVYIRDTFYISIVQSFNVTNEEFGSLFSAFGITSTITYIIGGIISDRITSPYVMSLPFFLTAILGFFMSELPDYQYLSLIYACMGITMVMTFFSSAIKIIRTLGNDQNQGKVFGLMEGGKALSAGIVIAVFMYVFNSLGGGRFGLTWVIKLYSMLYIIFGIIIILVIPPDLLKPCKLTLKEQLYQTVRKPELWFIAIVIFCGYFIYCILGYIPLFLSQKYGVSAELSKAFSTYRFLMRCIGAAAGGILADKIKSVYKTILFSFIIVITILICAIVMEPSYISPLLAFLVSFFLVFVTYSIKGLYYATIAEAGFDLSLTGTVTGIVSSIGYISEIYIFKTTGAMIDISIDGYYRILIVALVVCLVGISAVAMLLLNKHKMINKIANNPQ